MSDPGERVTLGKSNMTREEFFAAFANYTWRAVALCFGWYMGYEIGFGDGASAGSSAPTPLKGVLMFALGSLLAVIAFIYTRRSRGAKPSEVS